MQQPGVAAKSGSGKRVNQYLLGEELGQRSLVEVAATHDASDIPQWLSCPLAFVSETLELVAEQTRQRNRPCWLDSLFEFHRSGPQRARNLLVINREHRTVEQRQAHLSFRRDLQCESAAGAAKGHVFSNVVESGALPKAPLRKRECGLRQRSCPEPRRQPQVEGRVSMRRGLPASTVISMDSAGKCACSCEDLVVRAPTFLKFLAGRLCGDDSHMRLLRLDGERNAANQPTAADWHDHRVEIVHLWAAEDRQKAVASAGRAMSTRRQG